MSRRDDLDLIVTVNLYILPVGSRAVTNFTLRPVQMDIGRQTVLDVKHEARVSASSFVVLHGQVLPDLALLRHAFAETNSAAIRSKAAAAAGEDQSHHYHHPHHSRGGNKDDQLYGAAANTAAAAAAAAAVDRDEFGNKIVPHLVVVACPARFSESCEWQQNPNIVARLLNAGVPIECALATACRSTWQRGFPEFFSAAQRLYKMVDAAAGGGAKSTSTYQRRSESVCMVNYQMQPVLPFNEFDGRLMLPPVSVRHTPCRFLDEWVCDTAREGMSTEEIQVQEEKAKLVRSLQPDLEKIEAVVVRVFGYHVPLAGADGGSSGNHDNGMSRSSFSGRESGPSFSSGNHPPAFGFSSSVGNFSAGSGVATVRPAAGGSHAVHAVPFTAFFVSRRLLLSTRSAAYNVATGTFASTFKFTRRLRAMHGMLEDDVDLHELRVVEGVAKTIAAQIHSLGVNVSENTVPVGLGAAEWCDLLLLEVVDPAQYAGVDEFLLPEMNPLPSSASTSYASVEASSISMAAAAASGGTSSSYVSNGVYGNTGKKIVDNTLFCMHCPAPPTSEWLEHCFGSKGYNTAVSQDDIRKLFWAFDVKCVSVGTLEQQQMDDMERGRVLFHNCSVLPGSRGAPLLRQVKKQVVNQIDATRETMYLFAGIERGRSIDEVNAQREMIVSLSSSEIARRDSLAYNVRNEAHASNHLSIVLLYQNWIAADIASFNLHESKKYIQEYLAPYEVFTSKSLLSTCHRLMLRDADDANEYGVDLYQHRDLSHALHCFRLGAQFYSTASIPNLTDYELELRNALQTNVCSCVVALKFDDGTAGAA